MKDKKNPELANELSQSKHHLESIFDSITEPIFTVNPEYEITRLNLKVLWEKLLKKFLVKNALHNCISKKTSVRNVPLKG